MRDWRKPGARVRRHAKDLFFGACAAAGAFRPIPNADRRVRQVEPGVPFFGDRPGSTAPMAHHAEHRLCFERRRPRHVEARNVLYSKHGMAWIDGALHESCSVRRPSIGELLDRPGRSGHVVLDRGTLVECDYPYSYGDWVHNYLGTLLLSRDHIASPVLIPEFLGQKSYVLRDLQIAGVPYVICDRWHTIKQATVLKKQNPFFYWTEHEVAAFQEVFAPRRDEPLPGSITYLARTERTSESVLRIYPHAETAEALGPSNPKIIDQKVLSPSAAPHLGRHAETVVADHGSGVLNIMFWRPKYVIELFVDNWWVNNNLFVANHVGVQGFGLVDVTGLAAHQIRSKIDRCIEELAGK